jgi:hypothetical protein
MPSPYTLRDRWLEWHDILLEIAKEREQCCKDVCMRCSAGEVPQRWTSDGLWFHTERICVASGIHERTYRESTPQAPEAA